MDKKLLKMEKKLAAVNGLQFAAGVAKKTPADKQLQRDAKAIIKKSMIIPQPLQDAAQWTSSVLSGDRFVSHSSNAAVVSSIAGLFTPEEYAVRQREVQEQASAAAAAEEEQKEAARREQSLELQRKKALREAALKKMSFDIDDEA